MLLAERIDTAIAQAPATSHLFVWRWRGGALLLAMLFSLLRFHTQLTYPWTLNFYALFCFMWIRAEIIHAERHGASWLEPAGIFSYSIYLIHPVVQTLWGLPPMIGRLTESHPLLIWPLRMGFIVGASYLFFLLVEKPSHALARRFQTRVLAWRDGPLLSASTTVPGLLSTSAPTEPVRSKQPKRTADSIHS